MRRGWDAAQDLRVVVSCRSKGPGASAMSRSGVSLIVVPPRITGFRVMPSGRGASDGCPVRRRSSGVHNAPSRVDTTENNQLRSCIPTSAKSPRLSILRSFSSSRVTIDIAASAHQFSSKQTSSNMSHLTAEAKAAVKANLELERKCYTRQTVAPIN